MEKHPTNEDILHKRAKQYTLGNIFKSILMYLAIGIAISLLVYLATKSLKVSISVFVIYAACLLASACRELLTYYQIRRRLRQEER